MMGGNKQQNQLPQDIVLEIADDTIVVPNIPQVHIKNFGTQALIIQPCQDLKLSIDSRPLTGIESFAPEFCQPITIPAQS